MRRNTIIIIAVCFLAAPLMSQTVGVPGVNDLTINGAGSGGASCVASLQDGDSPVTIAVSTLPSTPVTLAIADFCSVGAFVLDPTYSVDIDPLSLVILASGGVGPFGALFTAGPGGSFEIITAPIGTGSVVSQVALVNPAFATGLITTQAHDTTFCPQVTAGPTSDDGNVLFQFCSMTFDFFGTTYTEVYVNANGNLTFTASDGDWSPTEAEFLNDEPRIAPCWSDVSPNVSGSITITETAAGVLFDYVDLPAFGSASNLSTYSAFLFPNGDIDMNWGSLNPSTEDDLVGISPGGGALGTEIDLSAVGVHAGAAGAPIYEFFAETACGDFVTDLIGGSGSFVYDGVSAYTYTGSGFSANATAFSPQSGWDVGGDLVTISGAGFASGNTYDVSFGGTSVPATFVDACTLTCTSPAGPLGPVDFEVFENTISIALFPGGWTYTVTGTYVGSFALGDQDEVLYTFQSTVDGDFEFYGTVYTGVYVNSDGNITLGVGDAPNWGETETEMLTLMPRIAPHWSDMHPGYLGQGTVTYFEDATTFVLTFTDVPAWHGGSVDSTTTLDKVTGNITITQGPNNTSWNGGVFFNNVISGISPGGGTTLDPVDLSTASGFVGGAGLALFEWFNTASFSGGNVPWDLDDLTTTYAYDGISAYTVTSGGPTFAGSFTLGDDSSVEYTLQSPTDGDFEFYGVVYTSFFVNSNGNITFGSGDSDWSESEAEMLADQPRIAPHWSDMHPGLGGTVTYFEDDTTVVITYTGVSAYTTGSNGSTTTLDKVTGNITITQDASNTSYNGVVASVNVIVGLSAGGGLGTLTAVDLSTAVGVAGGANQALFEWFNDATFSGGNLPWDLDAITTAFTYDGISSYTVN